MIRRTKQTKTYTTIGYLRAMQRKAEKRPDLTDCLQPEERKPLAEDEKAQRRILNGLLRQRGLAQIRHNEQPYDGIYRIGKAVHARAEAINAKIKTIKTQIAPLNDHLEALNDCLTWHSWLTRDVRKAKTRQEQIALGIARKEQEQALKMQREAEEREQNAEFPNLGDVRSEIWKLHGDGKNPRNVGLAGDAKRKVKRLLSMGLHERITWPLPSWKEIENGTQPSGKFERDTLAMVDWE
jgi:hypothetical protein